MPDSRDQAARRVAACLLLLVGAALIAHSVLPGRIDPASFRPSSPPLFTKPLAVNRMLEQVELLGEGRLMGPEDVEPDGAGGLYCGNRDGTIRRLESGSAGGLTTVFATTGGRPLGL